QQYHTKYNIQYSIHIATRNDPTPILFVLLLPVRTRNSNSKRSPENPSRNGAANAEIAVQFLTRPHPCYAFSSSRNNSKISEQIALKSTSKSRPRSQQLSPSSIH
ncbi:hypothetical protein AABB24_028339, partial [Solanum stoloniferum]